MLLRELNSHRDGNKQIFTKCVNYFNVHAMLIKLSGRSEWLEEWLYGILEARWFCREWMTCMRCTYRWYGEISLKLTSANFIQSVENRSRDVNIDACPGGGHFNHAYVFSIALKVILPVCNATLFFCYRSRPTARHSQWRSV